MRRCRVAEGMRQRAEGGADLAAVIQRRRLAAVLRGRREIVLGVRQAVQHRGVLREQQREDKQQGAQDAGHGFTESIAAARHRGQRQLRPAAGSMGGNAAHQQGASPVFIPQVNGAPHAAQRDSSGLFFLAIAGQAVHRLAQLFDDNRIAAQLR